MIIPPPELHRQVLLIWEAAGKSTTVFPIDVCPQHAGMCVRACLWLTVVNVAILPTSASVTIKPSSPRAPRN